MGNNRVVTNASGTVTQKNHYYPFGTTFAESTSADAQPYKYNGKELDKMHGLNLYDYSARYYESGTGRFPTIDPLAELSYGWSPYAYCVNNPYRYIDSDGKFAIPLQVITEGIGALINTGINIYKQHQEGGRFF